LGRIKNSLARKKIPLKKKNKQATLAKTCQKKKYLEVPSVERYIVAGDTSRGCKAQGNLIRKWDGKREYWEKSVCLLF